MNLAKKIIFGGLVLFFGLVVISSFAQGENLKKDKVISTYYDKKRDSYLRVTLYPKAIDLYSKDLGNQKMKLLKEDDLEERYQSQKVDLSLIRRDNFVIVLAGDKNIFEGNLLEAGILENEKQSLLIANNWTWKNLVTRGETFLKPTKENIFNLTFNNDGKIQATTDCAVFEGTYQVVGEKIAIKNLDKIQTNCDNLAGEDFIKFLGKVEEFTFSNEGNLVFFFETNDASMSFVKK